ncbi:MAG: YkgJ family cysteine cluster protein [Planctomycetota bacterium]
MSSEEFLCARCARHQKTCCQLTDIIVTPADVERIASHTGQRDFTEHRLPANAAYADQDDDPAWLEHVFLEDGTRRVLKQLPDGDCTFLGSQGCVLPLEVRPLICRLYPFDYNEQGIYPQLASGCPLELVKPGMELLDELDIQVADARRWHAQLYEEIRLESVAD